MRKRATVLFIDTAITHEVRSASAGGPRIPLVVHSHPIVNDVGLNKAGWRDFSLEERRTVPDFCCCIARSSIIVRRCWFLFRSRLVLECCCFDHSNLHFHFLLVDVIVGVIVWACCTSPQIHAYSSFMKFMCIFPCCVSQVSFDGIVVLRRAGSLIDCVWR